MTATIAANLTTTVGEAAAHVQVATHGERPKAVAVVSGRLSQLPVHLAERQTTLPMLQKSISTATKSLSICVFTVVAATVFTFSQTSETPQGLNLPANNEELVDTSGRKITADVLGKTPTQLKIRTQDGNEHLVPFTRLSDETYRMIFGVERPQEAARPQERDIRTNVRDPKTGQMLRPSEAAWRLSNEMTPKSHQTWKTIAHCNATNNGEEKVPIQEIHQMYLNRDPRIVPNMEAIQLRWEEDQQTFFRGAPRGTLVNALDLIPKLEVKPREEDEKVCLKEKFNQLNIPRIRQDQTPSCSIYNGHNMYQFATRSIGSNPPNLIPNWRAGGRNRLLQYELLNVMIRNNQNLGIQKRMRFLSLNVGTSPIREEIVKHLLRNEIPVQTAINTPIAHAVMIIGFETKNGQTTWEYFDPHLKFGTTRSLGTSSQMAFWFE